MWHVHEKSINIDKFCDYLTALHEDGDGRPITVYMDNLFVHSAEATSDRATALGIKFIFSCAYSPEMNPIEFVFSKIKHRFRQLRAKKIIEGTGPKVEEMIQSAVEAVTLQDVQNCIGHVNKMYDL